MRFIIFTFLFAGLISQSFASTDSLIIKGRILNLNGRLYRQASFINFSRNNILQPQSELSKQAALGADGSFRVSLPMLYAKEEIYMDYGGRVFATFLGSPGSVEITFDGDSIGIAKKLVYFAGVNADANNQFALYQATDNQRLAASKSLGTDFFRSFWSRSTSDAKSLASQRAELRAGSASAATGNNVPSPLLSQWAKSIADDERLQILFEHALSSNNAVSNDLKDSLKRLAEPPLTGQRVLWSRRFGDYADLMVDNRKVTNPNRTNSLPVRLMASLIRENSTSLSGADRQRLNEIEQNGLAEKGGLDFMNKLFAKNELTLNLLFDFERESRIYRDIFDSTATEFLKARYLPSNFYKFTPKQQLILSKHIQSRVGIPQFRQSLDELVKLEVKDSADIRRFVEFKGARTKPTEVLPGYFLTASNDRGNSWLNSVLDTYKGSVIYLSKWSIDDPQSRDEMSFIPSIQSQLPENVVFIFVHLPGEETPSQDALTRQFVIRHKLRGIHLFPDNEQTMDLLFRLNPLDPGTFAIIRPNGKFASKNAAPPSSMEKVVKAILDAGR